MEAEEAKGRTNQGNIPSAIIETNRSGIPGLVAHFRNRSRHKRIDIFKRHFKVDPSTRLLDLGGWDGSHINALISDTLIDRHNVFVADISESAIATAHERYGFNPVLMSEGEHRLGFPDGYFDIVFCSSVIEHVTVPKSEVWGISSDTVFRTRSIESQVVLAQEIRRLGLRYYVQVPYRRFPIETHTWIPFLALLSRNWQLKVIRLTNKHWIKKTIPDFYLPTESEMKMLFPDAVLVWEIAFGLKKSIIAIRA